MLARVQFTIAAALVLVAIGLAIVLFGGSSDGGVTTGTADSSVKPNGWVGAQAPAGVRAYDFTLEDENDKPFSLAAQRGKPVLLTFLYSTCQDSCPVTAQTIRLALNDLGEKARSVPVVAISVDPIGDTRTNIRAFLLKGSLLGRMTYVRGTQAQLAPVWSAYHVQSQKPGTKLEDSHSVAVMLLDRHGYQRVSFGPDDMTPEGLAHDLGKVIASRQ